MNMGTFANANSGIARLAMPKRNFGSGLKKTEKRQSIEKETNTTREARMIFNNRLMIGTLVLFIFRRVALVYLPVRLEMLHRRRVVVRRALGIVRRYFIKISREAGKLQRYAGQE